MRVFGSRAQSPGWPTCNSEQGASEATWSPGADVVICVTPRADAVGLTMTVFVEVAFGARVLVELTTNMVIEGTLVPRMRIIRPGDVGIRGALSQGNGGR